MDAHSHTADRSSRSPAEALGGPSLVRRIVRAALFLVVGVAAGLLAFAGIVRFGESFGLPDEVLPLLRKRQLTEAEWTILDAALAARHHRNTILSVAILGAAAGGLIGLAAGLGRRTAFTATAGLTGGMMLGTLFGGLGGAADWHLTDRLWPLDVDVTYKTMAAHSLTFLVAGVGISLAAGLAAHRVMPTLGVVSAAALIAGLAYPGLAAFLFPVPNTDVAVPYESGPLLLWTILPTALMGLAVGRIGTGPRPVA